MGEIKLRKITPADREAVLAVEVASTPRLQYLPAVFDDFRTEADGDFFLAEEDDEIVACAKYTALPNDSIWLETLRVVPDRQGRGIGKQLYTRYFATAKEQNAKTMRMYTGITNAVSRGLAEHFGFTLEQTFNGFTQEVSAIEPREDVAAFQPVTDTQEAQNLLLPAVAAWENFIVMNRTFYTVTPELCAEFARQGMVYRDDAGSVLVFGARFSPDEALHIGFFAGDDAACIQFAQQQALQQGTKRIHCILPLAVTAPQQALREQGFASDPSPYIVMRRDLP